MVIEVSRYTNNLLSPQTTTAQWDPVWHIPTHLFLATYMFYLYLAKSINANPEHIIITPRHPVRISNIITSEVYCSGTGNISFKAEIVLDMVILRLSVCPDNIHSDRIYYLN